jgi:hypothetical protein
MPKQTKQTKQTTSSPYKRLYNEVIDEVREFALKHRTKWVRQLNGTVVGEGWTASEDREKISQMTKTQQMGNCVRESLAVVAKLRNRTGVKWVQGELRSRQPQWKEIDDNRGMPIYHCWVELDDKVYDFANGSKTIADRDLYYMYRRVVKSREVPYVLKQISENEYTLSHNVERDRQPFYDEIRRKQRRLGYIAPA